MITDSHFADFITPAQFIFWHQIPCRLTGRANSLFTWIPHALNYIHHMDTSADSNCIHQLIITGLSLTHKHDIKYSACNIKSKQWLLKSRQSTHNSNIKVAVHTINSNGYVTKKRCKCKWDAGIADQQKAGKLKKTACRSIQSNRPQGFPISKLVSENSSPFKQPNPAISLDDMTWEPYIVHYF